MKQKLYYLLALTFLLLIGTGKNVVHAATETPGNTGSSNSAVTGTSFSIDGTYVAGKGGVEQGNMESSGVKLRTNRNSNTLVVSVNAGYVISSATMHFATNDDNKDVGISSVSVDSKAISNSSYTIPHKGGSTSADIILNDIDAKDNITIYFGTNAGTQIVGDFHFTYTQEAVVVQEISSVTLNGSAISAEKLATLKSTKAVTIDGSSLNGCGALGVTLSSGSTTVTRSISGSTATYTFTINTSDNYTVTVNNIPKNYSKIGNVVAYSGDEVTGQNESTITMNDISFSMVNTDKTFQYGSGSVSLGGTTYVPLKLSTGSAVNVTFPTGYVATKVRVYGWSVSGNGKLASFSETNENGAKSVDVSSDIYYATNESTSSIPSVYEYTLDDWTSVYFNPGGSPSQPFVVMDFLLQSTKSVSDLTITSGAEINLDQITTTSTITHTTSSQGTVTYTSSNPAVATVSDAGVITAVANGTATITVSQAADNNYQAGTAIVTVTVNNGVIPSYTVDAILNNETGTILTSGEIATQGNAISLGINTANTRVEANAADAVVTIAGNYYNDHGSTNLVITVKATGNMKFTIGNCTYNNGTATLKDAQDNTIKSVSLSGTGCWKGAHTDITTMFYEGEATTLTLSIPSYCPYIKVESVGDIDKYTVTFMNGNTQVEQKQIIQGENVGSLPTPQYDSNSKLFLGWYADTSDMGTKVLTSTVPTDNVTYNAIIADIPTATAGYYTPSNATELVAAVQYANQTSSANSPAKIFLKNGTYDLGSIAEIFQLTGSYVSIIGESLDGTVITNVPTQEGLGTATLLYNKGQYNYLQDLTLHNNYPYGNSTGRAASLKDEGNYTICNNVWLYSHQDTYYSHRNHSNFYFKGGKISGCVDYMCGQGRVYFDGVTLSNDNRGTTMTANSELYVFNNCTIENGGSTYNFGRAWGSTDGFGDPVCVFLNTTLKDDGSKLASTRWNLTGISTDYAVAGEYGTKNASGTVITPANNNVKKKKKNTALNTILTAEQAAQYTMGSTLGDWATTAANDVAQATVSNVKLNGTTLSWTGTSDAYLIENDGEFVALTDETSYTVNGPGNYTVRAANYRGGFGEVAEIASEAITTNTFGNASHVAGKALDFSGVEGLKAYVATAANGAGITLAEVTAVPAGTAFVVQATEKAQQTYYIPTTTEDVTQPSQNVFEGSATEPTATESGYTYYALSKSKGMFAKVGSSVASIPAGKAFVKISNNLNAKETLMFFFDGETTGIVDAEAAEAKQNGVRKQFINGQLIIIKGDKQYNAAGGEF